MQRFIDELRQRPKAVRAQVAFVIAASVTGLMSVGWLYGLGDRLAVESADPTIARLQREQAAEQAQVVPESDVGSIFSRLQRGAAAVIFNNDAEENGNPEPDNTIDINALLQRPTPSKPTPAPAEQIVVPAGTSSETEGSVILIGTSTRTGGADPAATE